MPGFYLIPYWTCFARKTAKVPPLPIWQKFMMLNPLSFCGGYSTITLWMNSSFICFLIPPEKGVPYRIFFLPGNGSCIKSQLFPTVSAAWFTVILAGCNSNEWISLFVLALKRRVCRDKIHYLSLQICNGHREQTTLLLKINPAILYRKMKKIRTKVDWKHE